MPFAAMKANATLCSIRNGLIEEFINPLNSALTRWCLECFVQLGLNSARKMQTYRKESSGELLRGLLKHMIFKGRIS